MHTIKLGFGKIPQPEFIFISGDHSKTGWHRWDFTEEKAIAIEEPALTGYITGIAAQTISNSHGEHEKLRVAINAGPDNFVLQTGFDRTKGPTAFARGLLAALATIAPEDNKRPLTIHPEIADNKKSIFAKVYFADTGQQVMFEYPKEIPDVLKYLETAQATFGTLKFTEQETQQTQSAAASTDTAEPKETTKPEEAPKSTLENIQESMENVEKMQAYIRWAGSDEGKVSEDTTITVGGKPQKLKEFTRSNWKSMATNFRMTKMVAQAFEDETGIPFESKILELEAKESEAKELQKA
jgi:hypothetical protein